MRLTTRGAAVAATGITVAMLAAACTSGGTDTTADATVTDQATVIEDEHGDTVAVDGGSTIDAAHSVGAMPDFEVGTHFMATEPITIDVLYRVHPNYPVQEDWLIWQAFRDDNNVTFNRTDVQLADWDQRRQLLVASGDFPTLVPVVWPDQGAAWIPGGALLPISDYFEYMPNLQHFLQAWDVADEYETLRSDDGKIYILPGIREYPNIEHSFAINQDLFSAAGYGPDWQPATFDELGEALRAVQAQTDVDYAYSDRWNNNAGGVLGATLQFAAPNYGTTAGWFREVTNFDHETGEFVPRVATDGFRELIQWFADLRADGVLDPEITQQDEEAISKFINGRSAMIASNAPEMQTALRDAAADIGINLNTRLLTVPGGPAGSNIVGAKIGPGIALNANVRDNPNFLAILQFIDWLYFSEEGREFAQWGVEGVTFEREADGTRVCLNNISQPGCSENTGDPLNATYGFQDGVWMQNWGGSNELVESAMSPETIAWRHAMMDAKTVLPVNPPAPLTPSEQEQISLVQGSVLDASESGVAEFINGTRPMSDWDSFVASIRSLGADQIADLQNTAMHRFANQ